jgi:hypothetical protein
MVASLLSAGYRAIPRSRRLRVPQGGPASGEANRSSSSRDSPSASPSTRSPPRTSGFFLRNSSVMRFLATSSGSNTVITDRASSVQDFESGLANNGSITGGVFYLGHAGELLQNGSYVSALEVGQASGISTNVSLFNVSQLTNTNLASNVTMILNGRHAGLQPSGGGHSVAQEIANQLGGTIYAWKILLFFSVNPNATNSTGPYSSDPSLDPLYGQNHNIFMIPEGGPPIAPCAYQPNRPEPLHCGGVK